ncbi:LacI family transcriptional regulator [Sporolactobacillus kofuensis]|nr:LacI family transcriptional regulator [Sporolactobacillus kofuensis]
MSPATVSRVLNNKGYVSEEKLKIIDKVIKEMNFQPNQVARGLTKKSSKTLALLVTDITNPFFSELAKGAEKITQQLGYSLLLGNTGGNNPEKNADYMNFLKNKYIDGFIIATHDIDVEVLKKNYKSPMVILEADKDIENLCTIKVDNYHGAIEATKHLLSIGCQKIAHIYGPQYDATAKDRLRGFKTSMKHQEGSSGIEYPGDFSIMSGIESIQELLKKHSDIDGIFAGNDLIAIGVVKELNRLKIKIPEQIAVCGFDGITLTQITSPEITTIEQPIYKMGELAAERLIYRINHSFNETESIELKAKLVIRESTVKSAIDSKQ